jgi:nucleoside-diphosphate-sugar epimerase
MSASSLSGLDERDIGDVLDGVQRFAGALRGARILITGATGWFGTWLLDALVALDRSHSLGLTIVAASRNPAAFRRRQPALYAAPAIEWYEVDVRDSMVDAPGPFTHIIHAATEASAKVNAESPDTMFETIVHGTMNVLKLAAHHPTAKVLLVSSGAVYGAQPAQLECIAEDYRGAPDVLDAVNAYAEGKRAAELLGAIWHSTYGVHVTIARCFAFVGPHMPFDAHFAVGNFIRDALEGNTIRIIGDGRPRRSYLYMSDLVVWLLAILVDGRPMRPYNVGAPEAITVAQLAERCALLSGLDGEVQVQGHGAAGRDYVPDVARAARELDLRVSVPLDDAIARTMAWKRTRVMQAAA